MTILLSKKLRRWRQQFRKQKVCTHRSPQHVFTQTNSWAWTLEVFRFAVFPYNSIWRGFANFSNFSFNLTSNLHIFVYRLRVIKDLKVMCGQITTRENTRSKTIAAEFCFSIGYTINVKGKRGFETPHNIPERAGYFVCTKDPLERSLPRWKKSLWLKARELLDLYDPVFAAGE